MSQLLKTIWYYSHQYWIDIGDPRTADYPMVGGGAWKIAAVLISYWLLVKRLLPKYMENRPPYNLRLIILIYNSLMVLCNAAFFFFTIKYIDYGKVFLDFKYPDRNDRSELTMFKLYLGWFAYMSRLIDLLDTVFFVLRKKYNQVSFLHVYHHMIVPFLAWFSFKLNPLVPIIMLFALFNTIIHVIMYSYYSLASFGPWMQKYLWWKRYITQLQLLQFLVCGLYGIVLYFFQSDYPMIWFWVAVGQNPIFFYMFYDFYKKSYNNKKDDSSTASKLEMLNNNNNNFNKNEMELLTQNGNGKPKQS